MNEEEALAQIEATRAELAKKKAEREAFKESQRALDAGPQEAVPPARPMQDGKPVYTVEEFSAGAIPLEVRRIGNYIIAGSPLPEPPAPEILPEFSRADYEAGRIPIELRKSGGYRVKE
jgi:hypothetical protein